MANFKVLFLLFAIFNPFFLSAQDLKSDSEMIAAQLSALGGKTVPKRTKQLQRSWNPVKAVLFLTMYVYQSVISEQISAGCEFDRSCSNFSLAAIKELGFVKGICLSADRLTRCNGQAQVESEGYLINHSNGKTIDEPSMYRFKD